MNYHSGIQFLAWVFFIAAFATIWGVAYAVVEEGESAKWFCVPVALTIISVILGFFVVSWPK